MSSNFLSDNTSANPDTLDCKLTSYTIPVVFLLIELNVSSPENISWPSSFKVAKVLI